MYYWSLYLITASLLGENTSWEYIPIASFSNRIECEAALELLQETLILPTEAEGSYLKCLKTDEIVSNTGLPVPNIDHRQK